MINPLFYPISCNARSRKRFPNTNSNLSATPAAKKPHPQKLATGTKIGFKKKQKNSTHFQAASDSQLHVYELTLVMQFPNSTIANVAKYKTQEGMNSTLFNKTY